MFLIGVIFSSFCLINSFINCVRVSTSEYHYYYAFKRCCRRQKTTNFGRRDDGRTKKETSFQVCINIYICFLPFFFILLFVLQFSLFFFSSSLLFFCNIFCCFCCFLVQDREISLSRSLALSQLLLFLIKSINFGLIRSNNNKKNSVCKVLPLFFFYFFISLCFFLSELIIIT